MKEEKIKGTGTSKKIQFLAGIVLVILSFLPKVRSLRIFDLPLNLLMFILGFIVFIYGLLGFAQLKKRGS